MSSFKRIKGRKLLIASLGVAAVSYVGCKEMGTSGNLVAPPCEETNSCGTGGGGGAGGGGGGFIDAGNNDAGEQNDAGNEDGGENDGGENDGGNG